MIKLSKEALERLLKKVSYAASSNSIRSHMYDKVCIKKDESGFSLTCTDGHRVARVSVGGPHYTTGGNFRCGTPLSIVTSLLNHTDTSSQFEVEAGQIRVDDFSFSHICDEFPPVHQIMPAAGRGLQIKVNRKELVKQVNLINKALIGTETSSIIFWVRDGEKMCVSSGLPDAKMVVLEHAKMSGDTNCLTKISFNVKYVKEALTRSLTEDEIEIEFFGTLDPSVWKVTSGKEITTCVIMPMRV